MVEKLEKKEKKVMDRLVKEAKNGRSETEVETIADFMALAVQLKKEWFPREVTWAPWFRGHTEVDWKLAPKLYRDTAPKRGIRIVEDEIRQEFIPRPKSLYIMSTEIAPQFQGRGFGTKQKQWQIEQARQDGFEVMVTNMRQSNSRIINLNEKFGFTTREIVPGYYSDPEETALVMELNL
jgi:ribosomal protein S18 acetylase RimI-like enzyme